MANYVLGPTAARSLKQLLAGRAAVSRVPNAQTSLTFASEFPAPFTVRWAKSVGEGGSWIIWLPDALSLLRVGGSAIDVRGTLEAAGGDYPEGWYRLDALPANGGTLVLVVKLPMDETKPKTATFKDAADDSDDPGSSEETDNPGGSEETDKPPTLTIPIAFCSQGHPTKAFVTSAIISGGNSGNYVAGADTNIVFSANKDANGNDTGEIAVDVYYK